MEDLEVKTVQVAIIKGVGIINPPSMQTRLLKLKRSMRQMTRKGRNYKPPLPSFRGRNNKPPPAPGIPQPTDHKLHQTASRQLDRNNKPPREGGGVIIATASKLVIRGLGDAGGVCYSDPGKGGGGY